MAEETSLLATKIDESRKSLNALYERATTKAQKQQIGTELSDLDKAIMRLISINVKASGKEYEQATAALSKANLELGNAIQNIENFTAALDAVASAVKLISGVRAG